MEWWSWPVQHGQGQQWQRSALALSRGGRSTGEEVSRTLSLPSIVSCL